MSERITSLQSDVVVCSLSDCSAHDSVLDSYGSHLVSTLVHMNVFLHTLPPLIEDLAGISLCPG